MARLTGPTSPDEAARLAALRDYRILDTPPEAAFDDLALLATQLCGTPISLISFVDAQRVWLKARVGLTTRELAREGSVCARVVVERQLVIIEDVAAEKPSSDHCWTSLDPTLRFYAGMPLLSPAGFALGTLCVLDRVPRRLQAEQIAALEILARQVITQLELRRGLRRLEQSIASHERSEAALRSAEAKYRSIFENVVEGIFQTTPDGHYLSANPMLARIYGYDSPAELVAAVRDIGHQLYVEAGRRDEFVQLMQRGGEVSRFESQIYRKDGTVIWISENARAVREPHGRILYYEGTVEDITERKRAEEALRDSEALYHSLVEHLPQNIFRKDVHGRFTFVNRLFCQSLGRRQEDILGKTDFDFFPPELATKYQRDDQRVLESCTPLDTVEAHVRPDGTKMYVHVLKAPMCGANGRVTGIQGIFWDETERRQIENALAYERDLLGALLEHVPDCIYFKDLQSRFIRASRALAVKFGLNDASQLVGKTDFDFFTEEHARPAFEDEQQIIRTGQPIVGITERETLQDGRVTWALTSKLPFRNHEGEIVGTFGISKDVTALIEAERALAKARDAAVESTRLKSEFLANMSHEIRTPMNAIIGMTGLLAETELTPDQRDCVDTVRNSADALLDIINDILDFSKIEAGRMTLEIIDFDLREAVEGTAELLAEPAQGKGLELVCYQQEEVPVQLRGDPGRLRQILTNLIGNAIKFTSTGEVLVNVSLVLETETYALVRFEVIDSGIGISPEAQQLIFQAFSQADGSTTRKYGGTGLGLAISKQLAELMGGQIGVQSAPGQGATFWFTARFDKQAGLPLPPTPHRETLAGLRVLIVDDNATNRRILERQLNNWRMTPQCAAGGAEALTLLEQAVQAGQTYDIALLDMQMPEMDGLALAEAIKADPRFRPTKLIMLTSLGNRLDAESRSAAGIAVCLVKPVKQSRLFDTLATVTAAPETAKTILPTGDSAAGAHVGEAGGHALRILVAEDNMVNQKLALRQLRRLGHHADAVANGKEVLEAIQNVPYDALLLDCQMPELDGYQTARLIRQREAGAAGERPPLRIIAMTANALRGDREKCVAAGMDDYVSKPVRMPDLEAALKRAVVHLPPPAPPTLVDEEGMDLGMLRHLRSLRIPGDTDPVIELVDLFLLETEPLIARLRDAASRQDAAAVQALAHSLKGSASNLGAKRLASLCAQLADPASLGASDVIKTVEAVAEEFARARTILVRERGTT